MSTPPRPCRTALGNCLSRGRSWTFSLAAFIGFCCLSTAVLNILQVQRATTPTTTTIRNDLKVFLDEGTRFDKAPSRNGNTGNIAVDGDDRRHANANGDKVAATLERDRKERSAKVKNGQGKLSYLSCEPFGGPSDEYAQEMVYWKNIPSDSYYVSPFRVKKGERRRYMTFEPDGGGWNNIRMAMETVLGLAIATGRTLILPPEQRMYLLTVQRFRKNKVDFSFADFFPMHEIAADNDGLEFITMQEFLEVEAMAGHLKDKKTGKVRFPPNNRTDWNGRKDIRLLKKWLRTVAFTPIWKPGTCLAAFPASGDPKETGPLREMLEQLQGEEIQVDPIIENPQPVDSSPLNRMRENLLDRKELCIYNETMQSELVVHFMCDIKNRIRMLVHSYGFLFFESWQQDIWMKRFMRDNVRYIDEIQCAAARIVHAMREHDKSRKKDNPDNPAVGNGEFDTFHVRRGDFQFKRTRIEAKEIYENTKDTISLNATIYIATDERDSSFFDDMRKHYDIKLLDDFRHLLRGVNANYYGMIDQLIASRGRNFFGCWHSTFSGFIYRLRGYHSVNRRLPGHERGELPNSYYYVPVEKKFVMHKYTRLYGSLFNREFPTSWRDIDKGIERLDY